MSLQYPWHEIFAKVEPCHFPSLTSGCAGSPVGEKHLSTFLSNYSSNESAIVPRLTRSDELTLAFVLLLRAYTGSDHLSCGVLDDSSSTTIDNTELTIKLLVAELDPTATLLDTSRSLTTPILETGPHDDFKRRLNKLEEHTGIKYFNTTLYLTRTGSANQSVENFFDSGMILCAETGDQGQSSFEKIKVSLHYNDQLIDDWAAQNVLATFEHILCNVVSQPAGLLKNVNFVSARDQRLISTWNASLPPPAGETLNERLETIFHDYQHIEAVYTTAGSFTYGQLDDLSALLAEQLLRLGVKRNMIVPICMDKSRWATCAMVAVWKSGAAVTTMDPSYPTERLFAMINDMDSRILISDRTHASKFQNSGIHVLAHLDQLPDLLSGQESRTTRSQSWRMAGVKPEDLAQVAWTSGSSGKPKGVLHSHDRLTSEHKSYMWNLEYNGGQRVLQFGSYAFVAGVNDAFHTMLHGATLCVPSESERISGLPEFMSRARVSRAYLTPSVLRTLTPSQLPDLKHLCVGGETIDGALEQLWSSHLHFISLYGASEGGFMIKQTANPQYLSSGLLPVGGLAWLVDPTNIDNLVSVGAVGEIVFESHELAIGYLNDPDKTASTFIAPPAWARFRGPESKCRYLRMGDLARHQPDGSIVILGRADTQVKIHGQRVELQDVECVLRRILAGKSQVVVDLVLPCDAPKIPVLTAFCVLDATIVKHAMNLRSFAEGLRKQLEQTLPKHMIPRAFLFLENLPGGYKTDRKKLRTDASKMGLEALLRTVQGRRPQNHEDAVTENEKALARLWSNVLHLSKLKIGRRDNFIALGGDSMAAIRLVVVARTEGISLTTQTVLQQPVLEDMALAATTGLSGAEKPPEKNLTGTDRTTTARATDFQAWAALVGASNGGWIDHFGYDFHGTLDVHKLQQSCQQLVVANAVLGAVFEAVDDEIYMRTAAMQEIAFQVHQTTSEGLEESTKIIYAKDRTIPLGHPIVRFDLLRAATNRHRLIMRISHAQYDGFCAPLIEEHLRLLYLSAKPPSTLPYHEFTRHIHDPTFIQDAEVYWRSYLKDSQMPRLVQHRPSNPLLSNTLDGEFTTYIAAASLQNEGINLAAVVKSAWALVLSALSQSRDVVFGDFISGRQTNLVGIETVVGPCVNFTPVRVRFHPNDTNRSLLKRVQADIVSSIPYEALGFRRIIEHCTSWGPAARYSSIINFVTVEADATCQPVLWSAGDGRDTSETHLYVTSLYEERQHDKTDLWLLCRHSRNSVAGDDALQLELHFRYSTSVYHEAAIAQIASLFGETLGTLTQLAGIEERIELPTFSDEERQRLIPNMA